MRLLVFGDFHEGNQKPKARIDDFHETKIKLIQEIDEIAKKYDCKAKLQLGDFLDQSKYSSEVLTDIVRRWKPMAPAQQLQRLQNKEITPNEFLALIKDDIPLIGVVGNHELIGNSLNTLKQTSIYMLQEMGFMRLVDREHPIFLTDEETGQVVAITGAPYHIHRDKPKYVGDYIIDEKLGDVHIHLVHGNGINKAIKPQHTTVDKFLYDTKADITIMGHYHKGFPVVEHEGKYAFNPGSPHLLTADEIGRKPQVAILDITPEKIDIRMIPLKTGSDSSKILSREHIEEAQTKKRKMEEIKSTVAKAEVGQRLSIKDILSDLMDNQNIPMAIRHDLIERVEQKMEAMTTTYHDIEPYTIETIELVNFQSHKHTLIDCHPELNVFVGESGHGKTAIQRALSFVFEGKKGGQNYIHKGETECSVTLVLSNGNKVTRFVKGNGRGGYKIYNAKTQTLEEGNTKLLPLVQEMLGFFPLVIDEDLSIPLNFLKQGSSWYFIGDNMTAPNRAKVIGSFYQTHYADAIAKECEAESKKTAARLKVLDQEVESVEHQLIDYQYLGALKERLDLIESKKNQLIQYKEQFERAQTAYQRLSESLIYEQRLKTMVERLDEALKEPQQKLEQLKTHVQSFKYLHETHQRYQQAFSLGIRYQQAIQQLQVSQAWKVKHEQLTQRVQLFQLKRQQVLYAMGKIQEQTRIVHQMNCLEQRLPKFPSYELTCEAYNRIVETYNRTLELNKLLQLQKDLVQQGNQEKEKMNQAKQQLVQYVERYRQLLSQMKQCPICHSTISADTIDHIIAKHHI